jgi:hypothetical protein
LEKIFQKYFAKEDFRKFYGQKTINSQAKNIPNKSNINPINLINDDFNNLADKIKPETEDAEDLRFYENLFYQIVDNANNQAENNLENNLKIDSNNLNNEKELIGDICHITDTGRVEIRNDLNHKSFIIPKIGMNLMGGFVQKIIAKNPVIDNGNTHTGNYPGTNGNNVNKGRKYDLTKLNDQIIQKFGK